MYKFELVCRSITYYFRLLVYELVRRKKILLSALFLVQCERFTIRFFSGVLHSQFRITISFLFSWSLHAQHRRSMGLKFHFLWLPIKVLETVRNRIEYFEIELHIRLGRSEILCNRMRFAYSNGHKCTLHICIDAGCN